MGSKSHCSLVAYINIWKELLPICLRDKEKSCFFFSKLSNFYFDLRPPGTTPGQDGGAKTRPQGQLECANPRGSPGGGWSGLELTDTLDGGLTDPEDAKMQVRISSLWWMTLLIIRHTLNTSNLIEECFLDLRNIFSNQKNIRKFFSIYLV